MKRLNDACVLFKNKMHYCPTGRRECGFYHPKKKVCYRLAQPISLLRKTARGEVVERKTCPTPRGKKADVDNENNPQGSLGI